MEIEWTEQNDHRPPVTGRTVVEVVDRLSGRVMKGPAREFCWENVVKYRVIRLENKMQKNLQP
jgi:hypothetical protein